MMSDNKDNTAAKEAQAPRAGDANDPMLTERSCFVRHVIKGTVRLPSLHLLEFEDRLRSRTYLVGPAIHGGMLSVADMVAFAVYHAYVPELLADGLLAELPETAKWLATMQAVPTVLQMLGPHALPSTAGGEAAQQRVAVASFSLKPTWYGRNTDSFESTFGNSRDSKTRRRRALPRIYDRCLPLALPRRPLDDLVPDNALDAVLAAAAEERLAGMWAAPAGLHLDPAAG